MPPRPRLLRHIAAAVALSLAPPLAVAFGPGATASAATTETTAWQNGSFMQDVAGIVSRSDVVIGKANTEATQFLPLGNGDLGVAAWAANGFTAQFNRSGDTMPRKRR